MEEKEQRKFEIFETFDGVVGAFLGSGLRFVNTRYRETFLNSDSYANF